MLKVSTIQLDDLVAFREDGLRERIDDWIGQDDPVWAGRTDDDRKQTLKYILAKADHAGLTVETDFALFAKLVTERHSDERAFLEREDVADMIGDSDWNPRSKILRLEVLAAEDFQVVEETTSNGR